MPEWVTVDVTASPGADNDVRAGVIFSYVASGITALSPSSGPSRGGTTIKVRGFNLMPLSSCVVDGTLVVAATHESMVLISCQMPARPDSGQSIVHVRTADASVAGQVPFFYYEGLPYITTLQPRSGTNGGTEVTISGLGV